MLHVSSDLKEYVQRKIDGGEFASIEEFANEAMRVYRDLDVKYQQLRGDVQRSIAQAERGAVEPMDLETLRAELRREFSKR